LLPATRPAAKPDVSVDAPVARRESSNSERPQKPRVTVEAAVKAYPAYAVAVDLKKALDLSTLGSSQAAEAVRTSCLDKSDLRPSMELARELISAGIEGLIFPSVVGGDDNRVRAWGDEHLLRTKQTIGCRPKASVQANEGAHNRVAKSQPANPR